MEDEDLQIYNVKGAALRLDCSIGWIHQLVQKGLLQAYAFDDKGELVEHRYEPDKPRQGQGLLFFEDDIVKYERRFRAGKIIQDRSVKI